jgi:hypothetical protein
MRSRFVGLVAAAAGLQPRRIANARHSGRPVSSKSTVAETSRLCRIE